MSARGVVTIVKFCGLPSVIQCDGKCDEAWGINWHAGRGPKVPPAPLDPGTYEGDHAKPQPPYPPQRHNKWCARECERSTVKPLAGFGGWGTVLGNWGNGDRRDSLSH